VARKPLPPVTIRAARKTDAPALARMMNRLRAHHGNPRGRATATAVKRDGFDAKRCYEILIAEIGGTPAGYLLFHDAYDPTEAERGFYMGDLHVEARARRRKVGRALMAALAREAKHRKRDFLWWISNGWNDAARAFYADLGAEDEPVVAHALSGKALDALAAETVRPSSAVSLPSAPRVRRPRARR
jgi:ribosomal protein S18 acetylase RimI-like enzyme